MKKRKKTAPWTANECPKTRWFLALFVGLATGFVGQLFLAPLLTGCLSHVSIPFKSTVDFLQNMILYAWMFWSLALSIKWLTKTSLKAFILGSTRSINRQQIKAIAFLFVAGFILCTLPELKFIQRSDLSLSQFALCAVIALLFLWMQTTFEEFLFRGMVIRICYGDRPVLEKNVKSILVVIMTAIPFMIVHINNPEFQSLSGVESVFMLGTYFISGVVFAISDLHFGSLMPGILIHWLNNVLCFVFLTATISVGGTTSLFVNTRNVHIGSMSLVREIILFIPLMVFMILDIRRDKQKIQKEKCN